MYILTQASQKHAYDHLNVPGQSCASRCRPAAAHWRKCGWACIFHALRTLNIKNIFHALGNLNMKKPAPQVVWICSTTYPSLRPSHNWSRISLGDAAILLRVHWFPVNLLLSYWIYCKVGHADTPAIVRVSCCARRHERQGRLSGDSRHPPSNKSLGDDLMWRDRGNSRHTLEFFW